MDYGWMKQESFFIFKWFEGDQLPSHVSDLIEDSPGYNKFNFEYKLLDLLILNSFL